MTLASRFDMAKNAAMAAMSQISSWEKPCRFERGEIGFVDLRAARRDLHREIEHRALPRRQISALR